jgi:hypothetical protein
LRWDNEVYRRKEGGAAVRLGDREIVALVSAACLIGLTVVLKNVLLVPAETLSRDIVWHIIIYSSLAIFSPVPPQGARKSRLNNPLF